MPMKPKLCEIFDVEIGERFGTTDSVFGEITTFSINVNGIPTRYYNGKIDTSQNCANLFGLIEHPERIRKFYTYSSNDIDIAKGFLAAGYNYIARDDKSNDLWVYEEEPKCNKYEGCYYSENGEYMRILNNGNMEWLNFEKGPVNLRDIKENIGV